MGDGPWDVPRDVKAEGADLEGLAGLEELAGARLTPEVLRRCLPDDMALPPALAALCAWADGPDVGGGRVAADFQLTAEGPAYLAAWSGGDPRAAAAFLVVAHDDDDGLYGYWRPPPPGGSPAPPWDLARAPLAYLDHEGAGSTLLAANLDAFLPLLALGQVRLGRIAAWDEAAWGEPDVMTDLYRDWLRAERGLAPPTLAQARQAVAQAHALHPGFAAWVAPLLAGGRQPYTAFARAEERTAWQLRRYAVLWRARMAALERAGQADTSAQIYGGLSAYDLARLEAEAREAAAREGVAGFRLPYASG